MLNGTKDGIMTTRSPDAQPRLAVSSSAANDHRGPAPRPRASTRSPDSRSAREVVDPQRSLDGVAICLRGPVGHATLTGSSLQLEPGGHVYEVGRVFGRESPTAALLH
jgi:hypothetical protein